MANTPLTALALVCSLKPSPADSSTHKLTEQLTTELHKQHGVTSEILRVVDYNIIPGVEADMGADDDWPKIRTKMLEADILILATPTWVGHMSSVAQGVIERLDAELSETDEYGRLSTYGKVAAAVVVGNEDGAHKISADVFQSLNDVGFSLAAGAVVYWNGEAMHKTDYNDLAETPEVVSTTLQSLATNTVHLARLLKQQPYPPAKPTVS